MAQSMATVLFSSLFAAGLVLSVNLSAFSSSYRLDSAQSSEVLFDPQHQRTISYKGKDFQIDLVPRDGKLALAVQRAGQTTAWVALPEDMVQVNEIQGVNNQKVVVTGMFNGDVWSVGIVNAATASLVDHFLCYEPSVSPDGKYLAFAKFFPPHGGEGVEYHYMVYNLEHDAAYNRPPAAAIGDFKDVGFTLYPFGIGNTEFDNLRKPENQVHILASGGFFWSSDSKSLVFADTFQGHFTVVMARFDNADEATVLAKQLPSICKTSDSNYCPARLVKAWFSQANTNQVSLQILGSSERIGSDNILNLTPEQLVSLGKTKV